MAVWNLDLKAYVTAYIVADTAEAALEKLRKHFEGQPHLGIEVATGPAGDFEISGKMFDDPDLPEISLTPAMSVYAPKAGDLPAFVEGDDEEESADAEA